MNISKELLRKNLIQIDKNNPDFYELERFLHILNSNQHVTLFVAYKQDLEDENPNINFIRIDLNQPFVKHYPHMVSSSKKLKSKNFISNQTSLISLKIIYKK